MEQSYFELLKADELKVIAFLNKQKSAATITLMGPTSSTKSTLITELLDALSNMLLGYNVGDTAQTTLLRTCLMLNSRFKKHEVIIQCIPHENSETILLKFLSTLKKILAEEFYESRDELVEFEVNVNVIKNILNPVDRSYHAFEFVNQQGFLDNFQGTLNTISKEIINNPVSLSFEEEANKAFKERRKEQSSIKKIDIYEEVFDRRFNENNTHREAIKKWFIELQEKIYDNLQELWTISSGNNYIACDSISERGIVHELMEKLYSKNSACSLIFEEICYATSPSENFLETYVRRGLNVSGRKLKLNILDTVGLTQSSQDKDDISDAMDKIFQRKTDAILFLCASDEQPLVYETCISLFEEKKQKFEFMPMVICRTKADIVLRNIMINKWRKDTGINEISDEDKYAQYLLDAFEMFKEEYLLSNSNQEDKLCKGLPIEFLSMAPDYTKDMNKVIDNELSSSKVFNILLSITYEIDKQYSNMGNRPWLYSDDINRLPLSLKCKAHMLNNTIGVALSAYNMQQENQYTQYINSKKTFHWRSVDCFQRKLSYGEGHETRAYSYGNFKLYIKNMVARWLRSLIPMDDMINDFGISYEHLQGGSDIIENVKSTFPTQFNQLIRNRWILIIDSIAKKLTYDCLQPELNQIFYSNYWDLAFRICLSYIDSKFSAATFWQDNLLKLVEEEFDEILQKMYVYDEV